MTNITIDSFFVPEGVYKNKLQLYRTDKLQFPAWSEKEPPEDQQMQETIFRIHYSALRSQGSSRSRNTAPLGNYEMIGVLESTEYDKEILSVPLGTFCLGSALDQRGPCDVEPDATLKNEALLERPFKCRTLRLLEPGDSCTDTVEVPHFSTASADFVLKLSAVRCQTA